MGFIDTSRWSRTHWLLLAIALSAILRVGIAIYLGDEVDAPSQLIDQRSYHALGARLIAGHGFSFDVGWYPFTPPDTPTAHWSFLYSLYVAGAYALFGVHPLAARLMGAIWGGILLPIMVYRLTCRLFPDDERVAIIATFSAAVYTFFVLYAATLMTETAFIVALLWTLERGLALAEEPTLKIALELGFGLGIATLLRQSILPWALIFFLWLLIAGWRSKRFGQMVRMLMIAGLSIVLCILPFTIRNYSVFDEFLLLNSNAGYAMYSAQHPDHGTNFQEFIGIPIPDGMWGTTEAQMDRELMKLGIGFVLDDPTRYLLLSASRALDFFEFWPTDTSLLHNVGRLSSYTLFLPFMLYGVWWAIREQRRQHTEKGQSFWSLLFSPIGAVMLFMLVYTMQHIFTWAMPRYRLPVDAVALSFAALAILQVGRLIWTTLKRARLVARMAPADE